MPLCMKTVQNFEIGFFFFLLLIKILATVKKKGKEIKIYTLYIHIKIRKKY